MRIQRVIMWGEVDNMSFSFELLYVCDNFEMFWGNDPAVNLLLICDVVTVITLFPFLYQKYDIVASR